MTYPTREDLRGKDLCPIHGRWIRFQDQIRPCPECSAPTSEEALEQYRDGLLDERIDRVVGEELEKLRKEIHAEECGLSWLFDLRLGLVVFVGAFTVFLLILSVFG